MWSDSEGRLWVSEWNSGNVSVYDPIAKSWKQWLLPGKRPRTYAVWVDADDKVWLSDWGANAIVRFDPVTERFESFPSDRPGSNVRQMLGRKDPVPLPNGPRCPQNPSRREGFDMTLSKDTERIIKSEVSLT